MIITRMGNREDLEGILTLQEKYLYSNLSDEERKRGFVTTPFSKDQLEEIITQNGIFIAEKEGEVIGYAVAGSWKYFEQWEIFNYMVSRFSDLSFQGKEITTKNSFQYGPVCIEMEHRGKGLLNKLFEEMRLEFREKYPLSITFINKINVISEKAHTKKLGWVIIDEFQFNNNTYIALAFDMEKSVV